MDSLGGFYDPTTSTPRPSTPTSGFTSASDPATGATSRAQGGEGEGAAAGAGIEKEVASVMSGLGSFWGKVRKQAATAAQSAEAQYSKAQKDLTPFLARAQEQLDTISAQTKAELARLSEQSAQQQQTGVMIGADGVPVILDEVPKPEIKGKGVDREALADAGDGSATEAINNASSAAAAEQTPAAAAAAFFRTLSTNAAPQLQSLSRDFSSLQHNLQSKVTSELSQLQTQLQHLELGAQAADAQKLAEGYLHKGEHWLAEFSSEVGKLAKDAVRVVPPTASSDAGSRAAGSGSAVPSASLSRRELLLYKLRTNPSLLLLDPALPPPPSADPAVARDVREAFAAFVASLQQSTLSGFDTPQFRERVEQELREAGEGLAATLASLTVGDEAPLSEEAFWTRYFFRKSEIEEEEGRRKRVLQGASAPQSDDDDFSWDMDDEESSPASPPPAPSAPSQPLAAPSALSSAPEPAATDASALTPTIKEDDVASPRASSESNTASSYDVVGEKSSNPSGDEAESAGTGAAAVVVEEKMEKKEAGKKEEAKKEEESDDSDWE
ncbi:hypothetical protein JCM8097_008300 [Rhodosporidiobolus ruineniae]